MIRQEGNKYVLYNRAGTRVLGRHPSRQAAMKQEYAVLVRQGKVTPKPKTKISAFLKSAKKKKKPNPEKPQVPRGKVDPPQWSPPVHHLR
jgi:hypothetical protein